MSASACRPLLLAAVAQLVVFAAPAGAAPQRVGCIWDGTPIRPSAVRGQTLPIDGQLYCFGSFFNQAIQSTVRVDAYDPLTDSWSRKADLPSPTTHVAFAREGRNVWVPTSSRQPGHRDGRGLGHDVDLGSFTAGPSMPRPIARAPPPSSGVTCTTSADARRIATRRRATTGSSTSTLLARLAAVRQMPEPRCRLSGAALGGGSGGGWPVRPRHQPSGHALGPRLRPRHRLLATWGLCSRGALALRAGHVRREREPLRGSRQGSDHRSRHPLDMLELDPVLGVWSLMPPLPNPRYGAGVQPLNRRIYAVNGAAIFAIPGPTSTAGTGTRPSPIRPHQLRRTEVVSTSGSGCWCGDIGFQTGTVMNFNPNSDVQGTDDDAVFAKQRQAYSNQSAPIRNVPLGNGFFRVSFHLAEH